MATQSTATTRRTSPVLRFGVLEVAILAIIAALILAVAIWSQVATNPDVTVESQTYGAGYPLHGGLAGPAQVSVFGIHPAYAAGYPEHGGLAGPSRVVTADPAGGFGAGYPLNGGLAGPSRVSTTEVTGYGAGYPLLGGLAGPSQVGEDR